MQFPGRIIKAGEKSATVVRALKLRLNDALGLTEGLALDADNPAFGPKMTQAVMLFQARHVDSQGAPLKVDGEVGSVAWEALFGADSVPGAVDTDDALLRDALKIAQGEAAAGVREVRPPLNRGPRVDDYQTRTGLRLKAGTDGFAWCACFLYYCFDEAAKQAGRRNPLIKTAGCQDHWNKARAAGITEITGARATQKPALVKPGMIFIMAFGGGTGHTGIVESVQGGFITTIEGNSNNEGSRDGFGVFRLTRKINTINRGFIDYAGR
ncbi:CHAP domain-containing protein [Roseateles sp. DC23W]|uniref:CHAP domain-containing protein n=1 Tax=Pelomonas dachongensis TaxID=3299029 RepID=A0ABW7ET73_9BURK